MSDRGCWKVRAIGERKADWMTFHIDLESRSGGVIGSLRWVEERANHATASRFYGKSSIPGESV